MPNTYPLAARETVTLYHVDMRDDTDQQHRFYYLDGNMPHEAQEDFKLPEGWQVVFEAGEFTHLLTAKNDPVYFYDIELDPCFKLPCVSVNKTTYFFNRVNKSHKKA